MSAPPSALVQSSTTPRIFIAEDDPGVLELVATRLTLAGFTVRSARNGWRAFEDIQAWRPNGVVLDVNMPGMDGFGVLRSMRGARALAQIPVLMLTARGAREDVTRAIDGGAQDYLTKPFNDQELIPRVHRLVGPRREAPAPKPNDDAVII